MIRNKILAEKFVQFVSILPLRKTLLVCPDDGLGLLVGFDDEGEHAVPEELLWKMCVNL